MLVAKRCTLGGASSTALSAVSLMLCCFTAHAGTSAGTQARTSVTPASVVPSHIQVLAASCAACHGPEGNSVSITPVLAGLDADYFVLQMQAFRSGQRKATVMHQHARGLTVDETEQLGQYFSQQKRSVPLTPASQSLNQGLDKNSQINSQKTSEQKNSEAEAMPMKRRE